MVKKNEKDINQFKQGISSLRTNFGELAQLMVKKIWDYIQLMMVLTILKMIMDIK